jgi:hypothetical protein
VLEITVVSLSLRAMPGGMSIFPRAQADRTAAFRKGVTSNGSSTGFAEASMFRSALRTRLQSKSRLKSSTLTTVTAFGTLRFATR